jgi:predicted MFS family arabinose efflux permease
MVFLVNLSRVVFAPLVQPVAADFGVPAFLVSGRLADRLPNVPVLLGVVGGVAVCVLALTVAEGLLAVAAVSLVLGYVVHSLFPTVDAYLLTSLPDRNRASAYALYSSSMMFVQALGSGSVGLVVARGVSYTVAFRALAGLLLVVVATMALLHRGG